MNKQETPLVQNVQKVQNAQNPVGPKTKIYVITSDTNLEQTREVFGIERDFNARALEIINDIRKDADLPIMTDAKEALLWIASDKGDASKGSNDYYWFEEFDVAFPPALAAKTNPHPLEEQLFYNGARSREQITEAAMCAWEYIDQTSQKSGALAELRKAIGTVEMRYWTGQIAERVSVAFEISEKAADGYFDEPFDWYFVPEFIAQAIRVQEAGFTLKENWREIAKAMGEAKKKAREI